MGRTTATILFTDLVGSTELRGRLGEEGADELRRKHDQALCQAVESNNGRVVKGLGDGIMATFAGASDAVAAAVAIQQAVDRLNRSGKAPVPLQVRLGLSAGDVAFEEHDVHGIPVIEASRLCAVADGGQILACDLVVRLAGSGSAATFTEVGALELKGLEQPVAALRVEWEPALVSSIPMPALLTDVGRIFVGRDAELERLTQLRKEAVAGERRVALLAGEPGVGKTRLAAELAVGFHEQGGTVLAGRCDEDLGVPYQPFVEALRHYVVHAATRRLGRYGGELARFLPELDELVEGLPEPLRSDPETERYRLFDAVAAWLADASAEVPVVLVLDDLQWAAKPTLLMLRHVLRSDEPLRVLVVATYRDSDIGRGHAMTDFLADLRRDDRVERLPLSGLDQPAVAAFIEAAAGHRLEHEKEQELPAVVWRETEGNPFFVREVLRHLAESRAIEQRNGRWVLTAAVEQLGIPDGVRDVVGRRLSRLSESTNRVLSVASVVGLEFEPAVVERTGDVRGDDLLAALEEAAHARLLSEVPGARYRFAHALIRATLYDELSGPRRVVLHGRVGAALEAVHANHLDDHLPALAYHWAQAAAPAADTARAIDYATRAGDRALAQLAHDEAVIYYRQALELIGSAGNSEPHRRTELLISLGEAQRRAGHPGHRETLLEAARLAREGADEDALARAALANTRRILFSRFGTVDHERIAMLEAALAVVGPADQTTRARLLAGLALELTSADATSRRLQLAEDALTAARRAGDPRTLANVLLQRGWATNSPATLHRRLADTAEMLSVVDDAQDPALRAQAALVSCRTLGEAGDFAEFDRQLGIAERLALDVGEPTLRWLAGCWRAGRALFAADLTEAEAAAHAAHELGQATGQGDADWFFAATLVGIRLEQGRVDEVLDGWIDFDRSGRFGRAASGILAWIEADLEHPEPTRRHLEAMASADFADVPANHVWMHLVCSAVMAATYLDDRPRCQTLHGLLEPYADHIAGTLIWWVGSVSHYLGLLAAALGRLDEADARFVAAETAHERLGAPAWLARTRLERARTFLARQQSGDADRARQLLGQALTTAGKHRLTNIERRAAALIQGKWS